MAAEPTADKQWQALRFAVDAIDTFEPELIEDYPKLKEHREVLIKMQDIALNSKW